MNTSFTTNERFESTYALIVRSEEKQRSRLETLLYTLLIASVLAAVSQFGRQAVILPSSVVHNTAMTTSATQHRT